MEGDHSDKIDIPSISLLTDNLSPSFAHIVRERRQRRLHPHFNCLKRTECQISNRLRSGRRAEEDNGFIRIGKEFLAVEILEDLVEPIFPCTLTRVPDERGRPAEEDTAKSGFPVDSAPAV
jgi:hypothetical protein